MTKRIKSVISISLFGLLLGCGSFTSPSLKPGVWRGILSLQNQNLPFNFAVVQNPDNQYQVYLKNGNENVMLKEVTVVNDSVVIGLHIFDASLRVKVYEDSLKGFYIRHYENDYRIPFTAYFNQDYRFIPDTDAQISVSGTWEANFVEHNDTIPAVGIFQQIGNNLTGTFLTTTGDYRYLEGQVVDSSLELSTFDGNHAYLFTATLKNDTLRGEHWSGKTGYYTWLAFQNDYATLPSPDSITYLKEGYDKISFQFPNLNGNPVSLEDPKYQSKVVILQLLGSWCVNCLDETRFLSEWYKEHSNLDVEIIGLAFEAKPDFEYAAKRVKKMQDKLEVTYDLLIAGTKDKKAAAQALPMLNAVWAYPTTIFIGKDGKVKHIHTGFSGPGTGKYYRQFVKQFNDRVNKMLKSDEIIRLTPEQNN